MRRSALALAVLMTAGLGPTPCSAEDPSWTLRLQGISMAVAGRNPHVLTIHHEDTGSTPATDRRSAVAVELPRALQPRFEFERSGAPWGWGVDFIYFGVTADGIRRNATGTATAPVSFEVADARHTSDAAGEDLFYRLLEDNRLEAWTFDIYATRQLAGNADAGVRAELGVRFADFDHDYRAVTGIEGVEGTRQDSSSNYPRMMGPLAALAAHARAGSTRVEGYIGQSVVSGRAALKARSRHFTGSSAPASTEDGNGAAYDRDQSLLARPDVGIPITELRLDWSYALTPALALSMGAYASAWWDVPVPPGTPPVTGGSAALQEDTVVFSGVLAGVAWSF